MNKNKIYNRRKYWKEDAWKEFLVNAKKRESTKRLAEFFDNLLSEGEKESIMIRLAIFSMIRSGKSYREISKDLWVSHKVISAVKKGFFDKSGYKSTYHYEIISNKEKAKKIKPFPGQTIFDYWANFPLPSYNGRDRWSWVNYQG